MARVKCSQCNGEGKVYDFDMRFDCDKCNGTGYVEISAADEWFADGVKYDDPDYEHSDMKRAFESFKKAADMGHAEACCYLGEYYSGGIAAPFFGGTGFPKDEAKGREWYQKGADRGDSDSKRRLAMLMYDEASSYIEKENVTENDKKKAAGLFAKAADLGDMNAQYMFGLCYYHVIGVPQDDEKAAFWLRKAAAQGHEEAKEQLKEMGVPLTAPAPAPAPSASSARSAPAPNGTINKHGLSAFYQKDQKGIFCEVKFDNDNSYNYQIVINYAENYLDISCVKIVGDDHLVNNISMDGITANVRDKLIKENLEKILRENIKERPERIMNIISVFSSDIS